jgi:hypothetical protein
MIPSQVEMSGLADAVRVLDPRGGKTMETHKSSMLENPGYWRSRAEDARSIANESQNPKIKRTMLDVAAGYDRMAQHAEALATAQAVLKRMRLN